MIWVCLDILVDRVLEESRVLKWTGLTVEPESWEIRKGPSHFLPLFIWFRSIGRAIVVVLLSLSLGIVERIPRTPKKTTSKKNRDQVED